MAYIERDESALACYEGDIKKTMQAVALRYISENPPEPFLYKAFYEEGFCSGEDGLYQIDLNLKYPDRPCGSTAYACACVYAPEVRGLSAIAVCLGKTEIYVNGQQVYKSETREEIMQNKVSVRFALQKGKNTILFKLTKTPKGFGCRFGPADPVWSPFNLYSPFRERECFADIVYSDQTDVPPEAISASMSEQNTGISWYPRYIKRSIPGGGYAYAWTKIFCTQPEEVLLPHRKNISVYMNGKRTETIQLKSGENNILLEICGDTDFDFEILSDNQQIHGFSWLYLGEFSTSLIERFGCEYVQTESRIFRENGKKIRYCPNVQGCVMRPFVQSRLFGRWTYPLGVTMYGLMNCGKYLNNTVIKQYAYEHIRACSDVFEYAVEDTNQYGFPGVNHQVVRMHMLDDCGSFAMAVLESGIRSEGTELVADTVADFMKNKAGRQPDGAFYRECSTTFMKNTMWADDLYMSIPFLVRYYEKTRNEEYITDAAKQICLFRNYLYMPEKKLMSHVYNFDIQSQTGVPWGRGNGWSLFSAAELLMALPKEHALYAAVLDFFRELAEGVQKCQGQNGMWHQVLNDPTSYEEASCTAMFVYAFSKGVSRGWFREGDNKNYQSAAIRGFRALMSECIDKYGNVYGVCQGSAYAFSAEYYRNELKTMVNDTHGTGIILLAATEAAKLCE